MRRIMQDPAMQEAARNTNEAMRRSSLRELELDSVQMRVEDAGTFLTSLRSLATEIARLENTARVEQMRGQGLVESANVILANGHKFAEAATREGAAPEVLMVAELPANIVNVLRSSLESGTRFESVAETLRAVESLSRGEVTAETVRATIERLQAIGIRLQDVIRCR